MIPPSVAHALGLFALAIALLPAALFLANLPFYRRLPGNRKVAPLISKNGFLAPRSGPRAIAHGASRGYDAENSQSPGGAVRQSPPSFAPPGLHPKGTFIPRRAPWATALPALRASGKPNPAQPFLPLPLAGEGRGEGHFPFSRSRSDRPLSTSGSLPTPLPLSLPSPPPIALSILIPARNEEHAIGPALLSILACPDPSLEVIVLDDHSTDATAARVHAIASQDTRVRLVRGACLPEGWCGKQNACWQLAQAARGDTLVFMDADVRLAPDALPRIEEYLRRNPKLHLVSGVPRQITLGFLEKLLIPLIHFILMGYLPMLAARLTRWSAFAAGCGQLFVARRPAYFATAGHQAIRASLHDGVQLPRSFRRQGFQTGLFDATDIAECRMYQTSREVWHGLGKNATEGMAHPAAILPWTVLLLGGQVLPWLLLALIPFLPEGVIPLAAAAAALGLLPRLISAFRFRQSLLGAVLHPLGIAALVTLQWQSLARRWRGRPMEWRGRRYAHPVSVSRLVLVFTAILSLAHHTSTPAWAASEPAAGTNRVESFQLDDQFGASHTVSFPRQRPLLLLVGDRRGSEEIDGWIEPLKQHWSATTDIHGIADVQGVPRFLRERVTAAIRKSRPKPLLLDFEGKVVDPLRCEKRTANIFVISPEGMILAHVSGPYGGATNAAARLEILEAAIGPRL